MLMNASANQYPRGAVELRSAVGAGAEDMAISLTRLCASTLADLDPIFGELSVSAALYDGHMSEISPTGAVGLRALVVDWGGVLTNNLDQSMAHIMAGSGVDMTHFSAILGDWLGPAVELEAHVNPLHALERGEIAVPHFEERLADELARRQGSPVDHVGLLQRMFDAIEHAPQMNALVLRARALGIGTALLSNSWGNDYPRDGWDDMFDVVVISGEVGMRKPEPRIYQYTLAQLGVAAHEAVFVDDIKVNVDAAVAVGMVGIHHGDYDLTAAELDVLFALPLSEHS